MKIVIDISEELYKKVVEHVKTGYVGSDVWIAVANGIPIDNAPTVEITDYDTGYQDGLEDGLNDTRPQGEWEEPFEHNGKIYHRCNRCHISSPLMLIDNYCSYCGAEMRKEVKKNDK